METQTYWNKIKNWLKGNQVVAVYVAFAMILEMLSVFVVEGNPFLSRPFLGLGILIFMLGIVCLFKNEKARFIFCACLLAIQAILELLLILIYDMTGQYFYFEMMNLRNDAIAALDSIPVNFVSFYSGLSLFVIYLLYGARKIAINPSIRSTKETTFALLRKVALLLAGVCMMGSSVIVYYPRTIEDRYEQMISGNSESVYSEYGLIGNMVGEFGSKMWERKEIPTDEKMEEFLYAADNVSLPTKYFGVAENKNVIVILAESFEWFSFLNNDLFKAKYPNALPFTEEELSILFPNLTKFYNDSVIASNFHSREKTDISETLSIMGSYPLDAYVCYDYEENVMPTALPNILKLTQGDMQIRSFHNGDKTYYNRVKTHASFGFDEGPMDKFDMEAYAIENTKEGEKPTFTCYYDDFDNLDSEMIETCKDLMFPTDKRFFTYITTITMHGAYAERVNLKEHREKLIEVIGDRMPEEQTKDMVLFDYMNTAQEFDLALGLMMEDLEKKGILDDTLIVMFGDHNAYFQTLSNHVKEIEDYETKQKYTDLYNVPLMIYDQDLTAKLSQEERVIDKFACTADIAPTILDLLGIRYYGNMFYGNSLFSAKQSVLYSRAYGIFVSEGIVGNSVNNVVYCHDDVTEGEMKAFRLQATKLVEKMKYCDYIFIKDWYKNKANLEKFQTKMLALNSGV